MWSRTVYFARETLISLRRNLLMTLAGVITVFVSLSVLGGALLISRIVDHGTKQWQDGVELEVFMNVDATDNQIAAMRTLLAGSDDVRRFTYLSKDDAYREFKRIFRNDPDFVSSIDASALPPSFRVAPSRADLTDTLARRFEGEPGVDEVKTASKEVKRLLSATRFLRLGFMTVSFVLGLASLFLIVNTIRLATFARRREIEVMKLVGASNWFVRVPFMLEGLVQGLIGAGFAFGAVAALKVILTDVIDRNSAFYRGFYLTNADATQIGIVVLLLGATLGVIGSVVGLRRFIET